MRVACSPNCYLSLSLVSHEMLYFYKIGHRPYLWSNFSLNCFP